MQHETQEDQEIQKGGDLIPGELGALGMGTEEWSGLQASRQSPQAQSAVIALATTDTTLSQTAPSGVLHWEWPPSGSWCKGL